jgi:hypothetical protein
MVLRRGTLRPGDEAVRHGGRIVLLFRKSIATFLRGRILDVRKTQAGPKLGLRRGSGDAQHKE